MFPIRFGPYLDLVAVVYSITGFQCGGDDGQPESVLGMLAYEGGERQIEGEWRKRKAAD